ncbi:MAG: 2-C-methyl-D-erythritol 2,4-cyclodiphosphate synthase [Clostridiales bacterium]
MNISELDKKNLVKEIAFTLSKKQKLSYAVDFHAFVEGRKLVLAGVEFDNFNKGPNTRRTDGDVVAHAIVMALSGATNTGDIDDWFPDKGKTGIRSMDYLPDIYERLIKEKDILIGNIDVTIICGEQPRMKKRVLEMRKNISNDLKVELEQVHVKVSSKDGKDEMAKLEGIEAHVIVSLWEGL